MINEVGRWINTPLDPEYSGQGQLNYAWGKIGGGLRRYVQLDNESMRPLGFDPDRPYEGMAVHVMNEFGYEGSQWRTAHENILRTGLFCPWNYAIWTTNPMMSWGSDSENTAFYIARSYFGCSSEYNSNDYNYWREAQVGIGFEQARNMSAANVEKGMGRKNRYWGNEVEDEETVWGLVPSSHFLAVILKPAGCGGMNIEDVTKTCVDRFEFGMLTDDVMIGAYQGFLEQELDDGRLFGGDGVEIKRADLGELAESLGGMVAFTILMKNVRDSRRQIEMSEYCNIESLDRFGLNLAWMAQLREEARSNLAALGK